MSNKLSILTATFVLMVMGLSGQFLHVFSKLADFFRELFFWLNREEMPFYQAKRGWIGWGVNVQDNTSALGARTTLIPQVVPSFVNCPLPTLDTDANEVRSLVLAPYGKTSHDTPPFFGLSKMNADQGNFPLCWCRWRPQLMN